MVKIATKNNVEVYIPETQLLENSVQLTVPNKQLTEWTNQDHADSFDEMQKIAGSWGQYLIYGKDSTWELVPYEKCNWWFTRMFQQMKVLWRTVFGGIKRSESSKIEQSYTVIKPTDNDAFCNKVTIDKQCVLTGKKVNVLYNYAPIGFGGEKLHFLVVPKRHAEKFTDVTKEEYCEALDLSTKLIKQLKKTREIKNVYFLNKTGIDAGQTVPHCNLQLILTTNSLQDICGKLTVVKNIVLGSSPMETRALAKRVTKFKDEFQEIS